MHESILKLAAQLSSAGEEESRPLELLCTAAEEYWLRRLRPGLTPEQCGSAYLCASAYSAAAGMALLRDGGVNFTAGDVSVSHPAGAAERSAQALRDQAERLMADFAVEDGFVFRRVRG